MVWNIAIISFLIVFLISALLSLLKRSTIGKESHPVQEYLLAGSTLSQPAVVSLLLSSSFGVNTLFYQGWLGYTVGAWGLVIQGAWALSFFFLSPFAKRIREFKSLHDLLGKSFSKTTKIVASLCTLIGIIYLMGWETGIGNSAMKSIFVTKGIPYSQAQTFANYLIIFTVFGSLFYTVLGGLRGNAKADIILNLLKFFGVCFLLYYLFQNFIINEKVSFIKSFFPSLDTMKERLGLWGLITNIAFSLAWQFVDNSSWQSIIAGVESDSNQTKKSLRWSGLVVFIAPGIIGTLLGVFLVVSEKVTQDNIFSMILSLTNSDTLTLYLIFIVLMACIMSMIDGLFLASAYTLTIDILYPKKSLSSIDEDPNTSEKILIIIRVLLIIIAIAGIWGMKFLFDQLGVSLFDFVYIVVITQLALIGPVIMGLLKRETHFPLWACIIFSLVTGFGCVILGTFTKTQWLIDGSGTFTITASIIASFFATWHPKLKIHKIPH